MSNYIDNKTLFSSPKVSQYNNHMVMTNVVRQTKTKYLNIDTKFCDEYVNNRLNSGLSTYNIANYTITLPYRINDVKSITVLNIEIPMTYYNISSAIGNNCFNIKKDSYSFTIIIPDGQYDKTTLVTTINTLLSSQTTNLGGVLSFGIFSNNISYLNFNGQGNINIDFAVDNYGSFDKYNFKYKLGWILGYRMVEYIVIGNNNINIVSSDCVLSESVFNLNVFKYFYLAIDEFSNGNQNSFISALFNSSINKNIIAKISIDLQYYPYGSILHATENLGLLMSDTRLYNNNTDIQKLNVQLLDENGNAVNLNGAEFSFGLKIEHE